MNIPIGADSGHIFQDGVCHVYSLDVPVVGHAPEQIPRLSVVGQVVGECTNGLTELVGVRGRNGPLDMVAFQVAEQCFQFVFCRALLGNNIQLSDELRKWGGV